jgi:hypothetical protein
MMSAPYSRIPSFRSDFDKLCHLIVMTAAENDRDRPDLSCLVMKTRATSINYFQMRVQAAGCGWVFLAPRGARPDSLELGHAPDDLRHLNDRPTDLIPSGADPSLNASRTRGFGS